MMRPSGNEFQDYCTMYGLMMLTWAWAETSLAMIIGVINENAGPIKGHPEAPVSLKKKIAYLKVALRDIPALKPFQQEGRALALHFGKLAPRRNKFVHSATWQGPQGGFQAVGLAVERGQYVAQDHSFNVGDARTLAIECAALQDQAAVFMLKIADLFAPSNKP